MGPFLPRRGSFSPLCPESFRGRGCFFVLSTPSDSGSTHSDPRSAEIGFRYAFAFAAFGELPIHDHGGNIFHTVSFRALRHCAITHIQHFHFTGRAGKAIDQRNGFFTGRTTGTEHFDFSFFCHNFWLLCAHFAGLLPAGAHSQPEAVLDCFRGHVFQKDEPTSSAKPE